LRLIFNTQNCDDAQLLGDLVLPGGFAGYGRAGSVEAKPRGRGRGRDAVVDVNFSLGGARGIQSYQESVGALGGFVRRVGGLGVLQEDVSAADFFSVVTMVRLIVILEQAGRTKCLQDVEVDVRERRGEGGVHSRFGVNLLMCVPVPPDRVLAWEGS